MATAPTLWDLAHRVWHIVLAGLALVLAVAASGHAVLYKRDPRAAISWVGFVWLVPILGPILYFVLGVNRIRRQAVLLRGQLQRYRAHPVDFECPPAELHRHLPGHTGHLHLLAHVVDRVVAKRLVTGNKIEPLVNGDETYPAMLEAIAQARQTVSLETYIFDSDEIGREFVKAFSEAARRGVEVRVLVDAAGLRYSWPSILKALRRAGVPCAQFLPSFSPWHLVSMNLRTHRKILVADGRIGFTGGINIRLGHCLQRHPPGPVQDLHFRLQGPVVTQLQEVFADDWLFTTGESLRGEAWFPKPQCLGNVVARGVADGPDEDFEKLRWTLLGALSIARYSIRVMTAYFVPDLTIISALNLAAMRGVEVDIILPAKNNLPFVHWASRAMWWQVLSHGCRVWLTPPPFDHSKLLLVDAAWALLGSANWDARSLRLNFEYNVECYDAEFCSRLERFVIEKRNAARPVTLQEVDSRPLPGRLRDGLARLLVPYL
jgi:cardiolipin synthase